MTELAASPRRANLIERFRIRGLAAIGVATTACAAGEWRQLRRQLHTVKGDARMLGLEILASYVELIYDSVSQKSMAEAESARVHDELGRLAVMLTGALDQEAPGEVRLARTRLELQRERMRARRPENEVPAPAQPEPAFVMVVDDSPVVRMMLSASLRARGAEVVAFSNVEQTLEAVAKRRPRVILTDVEMPGASGLALLEQIRERDAKLPVVLLSGQLSEPEQRRAAELGAAGVFLKSSDLSGVVDHVLGLSKSELELADASATKAK